MRVASGTAEPIWMWPAVAAGCPADLDGNAAPQPIERLLKLGIGATELARSLVFVQGRSLIADALEHATVGGLDMRVIRIVGDKRGSHAQLALEVAGRLEGEGQELARPSICRIAGEHPVEQRHRLVQGPRLDQLRGAIKRGHRVVRPRPHDDSDEHGHQRNEHRTPRMISPKVWVHRRL